MYEFVKHGTGVVGSSVTLLCGERQYVMPPEEAIDLAEALKDRVKEILGEPDKQPDPET